MPEISDEDALIVVSDDVPKAGRFAEPVFVARSEAAVPEVLGDDEVRVAFTALLLDQHHNECEEIAVEARIVGPHRTGGDTIPTGPGGTVTFRMRGPRGVYKFEVVDVAAGAVAWDTVNSLSTAQVRA